MLHLLLSRDWIAGREEILKRISMDVHQKRGGRILMVPELISHDTERRLCAAAGDTASRYAEVLSFTRLARRVADQMGAAALESLDAGGRVVAMAAAPTPNRKTPTKTRSSITLMPQEIMRKYRGWRLSPTAWKMPTHILYMTTKTAP